jgi:hypothetical protein
MTVAALWQCPSPGLGSPRATVRKATGVPPPGPTLRPRQRPFAQALTPTITFGKSELIKAGGAEMTDYDPDEMVNFRDKYVSLWTAVHDIMSQPPERRTGIAVFRDAGLEPSIFEAADIETMARLPAFKGPLWDRAERRQPCGCAAHRVSPSRASRSRRCSSRPGRAKPLSRSKTCRSSQI